MTARRADSAPRMIAALARDLADLKNRASRKGHVHEVVGRDSEAGSFAVGQSSPSTPLTVNITIPAAWTEWDLDVWWQMVLVDSSGGTGAVTQVDVTPRLETVDLGFTASEDFSSDNDRDVVHLSGVAFAEAQATTGSHTVDVQTQRAGPPTINVFRAVLVARATRVS